MRGAWGKKCLESMGGRRIIDRVETMDSLSAGREVGQWINGIIAAAEVSWTENISHRSERNHSQNMSFC
jgi:hypothetical protein